VVRGRVPVLYDLGDEGNRDTVAHCALLPAYLFSHTGIRYPAYHTVQGPKPSGRDDRMSGREHLYPEVVDGLTDCQCKTQTNEDGLTISPSLPHAFYKVRADVRSEQRGSL